ncbi:putative mau2 chromatid cohesion factor [Operophtera brumata]|uniref:MAU2 chromatid cohesion factor homolog n=1 Tax=Operophtera brumata TaxID=104452 RepID=A0A0L7LLK0_OPEBR|nr:putative mau2 chromatid cohesion factor [Operophtera brumata]
MASTQDAWYISLLGLAEHFRTSNPPDIKSCIQCLQAVFNFKPPQRVEARTHLQLGNILLTHTKNIDLARTHLEQSWCLSQTINGFDDVKFEAASVLADLFEQQGQPQQAKPILRKAIELSQHSVYWHCRLIFQLAQIHATEREYEVASSLLGVGVDYAQISNAAYTRLLLIDKKIQEVLPLLNQAGHLVDTWVGSPHQKEYLKVYFLVLQLYVLVYLVTVMHSAQAGYMDKAHKYTEKALAQIDKLTSVSTASYGGGVCARSGAGLAWRLRMALVEHAALCRLVAGGKAHALVEIARAADLLHSAPSPQTAAAHTPQLHCLLGLYAMSMNCMEQAESQFLASIHVSLIQTAAALTPQLHCLLGLYAMSMNCMEQAESQFLASIHVSLIQTAAAHTPQLHCLLGLYAMSMNCMEQAESQFLASIHMSQERDLWMFAKLNLAIVYLRGRRDNELAILMEQVRPEALPAYAHGLRAASYYVLGLQAFFQARYNEAKYLHNNSRESMNMVTPAMQLASKIPDVHVQLWASAILKGTYTTTRASP